MNKYHINARAGPPHGCGGTLNLTAVTTHLLSSVDVDSDGQYEPDLDCAWTVVADDDRIVVLEFNRFEMDDTNTSCSDFVEV